MNILAIGAHPDGTEIPCACTLLKYAAKGHRVHIIHACVGDKGDYYLVPVQPVLPEGG